MKICPTCSLRYPDEAAQCFVDRTALIVAPDPYLGMVIAGKYRVEGVIGAGGMATVYRARGTSLDRVVAVKIFRRELSNDAKLRERFRRESTNARRLAHRNVIEILEEGDLEDGTPFLVMEFLEGSTLEAALKRANGPLSIERSIDLMFQLTGGLARAHDFQVLHRDLKPDNLFLVMQPDGSELLKILDFGIARSMLDARLTGTGEIFGTPQYMAPERITSTESGPAADLYAVGCIFFRCVTGRLPFAAQDVTSFLIQHLRERPPSPRSINPSVPLEIDALILQCLEKEPARRPVDAHAIERVLMGFAGQIPRPRRASGVFVPPTPTARSVNVAQMRTTSAGGMFSSATVERWGRRAELLAMMVQRVYPMGPSMDLAAPLGRLRATVTAMSDVHARWMVDQTRIESIAQRTREAQGRFGHAMDALAQDLSSVRQRAQASQLTLQETEGQQRALSERFRVLHGEIVATGAQAAATSVMAVRYRAALEAMEPALALESELETARRKAALHDEEVRDLEFQISALRSQLERVSLQGDDEGRAIQKRLESAAAMLGEMEGTLVRDASDLTNALRGRRELDDLFRALEADAA